MLLYFIFPFTRAQLKFMIFDQFWFFAFFNFCKNVTLKTQLRIHKTWRSYCFLKEMPPKHQFFESYYKQNMEQIQATQNQTVEEESSKEWNNFRQQFGAQGESIGEEQAACDLIEKWVWINYQEEFKSYQEKLSTKSIKIADLIKELIEQGKQGDWKISQRYNMKQVQTVIDKLRVRCIDLVNQSFKDVQINPEKHNDQQNKNFQNNTSLQYTDRTDGKLLGNASKEEISGLFPVLKGRGKVYQPKQLSASFHLLKETEEQYKSRSPYLFQSQTQKSRSTAKQALFSNKYLKMTFQHFCKQSYNPKGLFDSYSLQADKMNLNKWMVFCKQFNFIQKFSKKEIIDLFQAATKFGSTMTIDDFCTAVGNLQQKYINRYRTGENFVSEVMQINTEAAFRVKMANLKVNYGGPKKNCFEFATYFEPNRIDQIQKEKQYKVKKAEKQMVLIKGMLESHLREEIKHLKTNRELKKLRPNLGNSLLMNQEKQSQREKSTGRTSNMRSSRLEKLNYSKIFNINKSQTAGKNTTHLTKPKQLESQMYRTQINKSALSKKQEIKKQETQTLNQVEKKINSIKQSKQPRREWIMPRNQESTWLTNVRSDSQESDQILKQHLQIQKKIKASRQSLKVNTLMKEMEEKAAKVEQIRKQIQQQQQDDDDMAETQTHFKKEKQVFP